MPELYADLTISTPPVATTRSDWRINSWVLAIEGFSMIWMRSSGTPIALQPLRIRLTASSEDFCVFGCAATMMAFLPFRAQRAFMGGVASGPVDGMMAATTPTGFAILTSPLAGFSSTIPTVLMLCMSWIVPAMRSRILMILSATLCRIRPPRRRAWRGPPSP